MKISNVSSVQNIKQHNVLKQKQQINSSSYYAVTVPVFNAYLGRDLVSFGNRPFYETLKENYFQLPKGYFPDDFQIEAGKGLNEGNNVLVEAPTGTGKTAIAHYAATKNLKEGKTTFYTTPLKALSNQKLNEFRAVYGDENVGILTGDRRENAEAPIVIMTTEVYRNMALQNAYGNKNPLMDNLGTVIFDEFHYLGDIERGGVWEEALMYTPKGVQTLELSATIGNPDELSSWIGSLDDDNSVNLVSIPAEARHVPLKFDSIPTKSYQKTEDYIQKKLARTGTFNYDEMDEYSIKPDLSDYKTVVNKLYKEEKLPAIFFVFSRKFSRELLDYFAKENKSLTTDKEKIEIKQILDKHKSEKYIGQDLNETALLNGYAIHNAGIIPSQKELIEELFQKKLIKSVIATETLAAGINMPAKTVVISSPYKPSDGGDADENNTRMLTSNEFKQMAGRAGRRGIDTEGYVYTMPTDRTSEMDFLELETMYCDSLKSHYDPDYSFLCGFYEYNSEPRNLKEVFERSFYAYNQNEEIKENNVQQLLQDSLLKTELLKTKGFITAENGEYELTNKGLMASKVKGYNSIPLVELIAGGAMSDITPETLALTAGAIANTAIEEDEITSSTDLSILTGNPEKLAENVRNRLDKSVKEKFKMLGKSINSFYSLNEMLKYAQNLSKPNIDTQDLMYNLEDLSEKQRKIDIIKQKNIQMMPEEVLEALNNDEILPSKVLQDNIDIVENFKKRAGSKDINSYIQNLEYEFNELSAKTKGKKAQIKNERKLKNIREELDNAKTMKDLETKLYDAMNLNQKFLKKNRPEEIKRDLKETQVQYVKLTSKDILVDEIKGLIELENYLEEHDLKEIEKSNRLQGSDCLKQIINSSQSLEEEEISLDLPVKSKNLGRLGAQSAYNWAVLNSINPSSMSNWQELLRIVPSSTDEGSVYRNILQTADLLSQIREIAETGMKTAETNEDVKYYNHLKKTAVKARELMIKPPVEV